MRGSIDADFQFAVSATERGDFMRCRRAWDFQSPNRQSLVRKGVPRTELWIGSAVHAALEGAAVGLDPLDTLQRWFDKQTTMIAEEYVSMTGTPLSQEERETLQASKDKATLVVEQYFVKYGTNPIAPYVYIAPEISFRVPIPNVPEPFTGKLYLVGTFDGLAEDVDSGDLWLVEHKTYSQKPNLDSLQTDDQLHAYAWAAQQLFGVPLAGALYDGLNKKVPTQPKLLQSGKLSKEWIDTTADVYVKAVLELEQDPTDEYYAPHIQRLLERERMDQTPFHTRWKIPFSQHALEQWGNDLASQAFDMANDPTIYPHFRWEGCWDCSVSDLCRATQFGEDVEYLIETNYKKGTYGTRTAQRDLTPLTVSSIADLKALMSKRRKEMEEG